MSKLVIKNMIVVILTAVIFILLFKVGVYLLR